jgi:hypothetical protein
VAELDVASSSATLEHPAAIELAFAHVSYVSHVGDSADSARFAGSLVEARALTTGPKGVSGVLRENDAATTGARVVLVFHRGEAERLVETQ